MDILSCADEAPWKNKKMEGGPPMRAIPTIRMKERKAIAVRPIG